MENPTISKWLCHSLSLTFRFAGGFAQENSLLKLTRFIFVGILLKNLLARSCIYAVWNLFSIYLKHEIFKNCVEFTN